MVDWLEDVPPPVAPAFPVMEPPFVPGEVRSVGAMLGSKIGWLVGIITSETLVAWPGLAEAPDCPVGASLLGLPVVPDGDPGWV